MAINILDKETVSQIAAGEVVERPASLVKELVENSLDAKASQIEVEFDEGGRFVKVKDNGEGIEREDLKKALTCHATSKIHETGDLWKLSTYGFRGEALASIASVSDLTLISKYSKKEAFRLKCHFGEMQDIEKTGGEKGTSVIVQSLFENVPARFKFLKSSASENTAIKNTLKALALSHCFVSFRVLHKGRLLFYWPSQKNLLDRCRQIFNMSDLYFLESEKNNYKMSAVVAAPHNTLKNRRSNWLFVCDRWVEDRVIYSALMAAYRSLLMHGEHPIALVKVRGPSEEIDVNVHPTKSQVRFKNSSLVFQLVESGIRNLLEQAPWTKKVTGRSFFPKEENLNFKSPQFEKTNFSKDSSFKSKNFGNQYKRELMSVASDNSKDMSSSGISYKESLSNLSLKEPYAKSEENFSEQNLKKTSQSDDKESENNKVQFSAERNKVWSSLQVLAQVQLTYLVCQSDKAVVFIDQHAAHERILYEKLFAFWQKGNVETQKNLIPFSLEVEEDEKEALLSLQDHLKKLGVSLEQLGPGLLGVTSAPLILKEKALQEGLYFLARNFIETKDTFSFEKKISHLCATMACHSAVRAGQSLSLQEMQELLKGMDEFPLSGFCPHGRPVFVEYPITKLEKDFGRLV